MLLAQLVLLSVRLEMLPICFTNAAIVLAELPLADDEVREVQVFLVDIAHDSMVLWG